MANGIAESYIVSIDSEMYRTFDKVAYRWSQWINGRNLFMPAAITVERRTDGTLRAFSTDFSRLIMFTAHGDPRIVPMTIQPAAPPPLPFPLVPAVGNRVPANNLKSSHSTGAPAHVSLPIPAYFKALLVLAVFIVLATVLPAALASPGFKGWLGEKMVIHAVLRKLDPALYRHFHDLYLPHPDGHGTSQIDHVVVSPFGIFVIETKNYRGWIFGSERQGQWTQQIYQYKSNFLNPLKQNHTHVRALIAYLGLTEDRFHSVVFFVGNCEFKTAMPPNVLSRGLLPWIGNHATTLLDSDAWRFAAERLDELDRATNRKIAARNHLVALKDRLA